MNLDMKPISQEGLALFHAGTEALMDVESSGIHIDMDYCKIQHRHIKRRITHEEKRFQRTKLYRIWRREYQAETKITSDNQLKAILFDLLELEPGGYTDKGNPSVKAEHLEKVIDQYPAVEHLVMLKRLIKVHKTYINNIIKEAVYDKKTNEWILYPFYHLNSVITFRSSSSNVNFQNQPKRVRWMKKIIRRAFKPSPGNVLIEIDYSGAEVSCAACYHKDPRMLKYLRDKSTDMHRDTACDLFKLKIDQLDKGGDIRFSAKNNFVFAEFYGDYFKPCAQNLWDSISSLGLKTRDGVPLKDHLYSQGIKTYRQFEKHVERVEKDFWGKKFAAYARWKKKWAKKYDRKGYIDTLTGFRLQSIMSKNEVINYPVQGAAFHWLLWSLARLIQVARKKGWKSKIIGQIHDAIVLDVVPEELNEVLAEAKKIMTQDIKEFYPWIIVPLDIEVDCSAVDGTWYDMNEIVCTEESTCTCGNKWTWKNMNKRKTFYVYECPFCGKKHREPIQ